MTQKIYVRDQVFFLGLLVGLFYLASFFYPQTPGLMVLGGVVIALIPGLLILYIARYVSETILSHIAMAVAISISVIMLWGLSINMLVPLFSHSSIPLSWESLYVRFGIFQVVLFFVALWRTWRLTSGVWNWKLAWYEVLLGLVPLIGLVLVILGAIQLNNQTSSNLSLIGISIGVLTLVTLAIKGTLRSPLYSWSIWIVGISLLLASSLRSNFITGWDINEEMQLFMKTYTLGKYSMWQLGNAYNACLSITILPVVLQAYLKIAPVWIFKVVYPIIFSLMPVLLINLTRRITSDFVGFLAAFYVIAQPFFVQPMIGIARQEIAFLLFAALLVSIFSVESQKVSHKYISALLGMGMILAHYSTTYVTLALFALTYMCALVYRNTDKHHEFFSKIFKILRLEDRTSGSRYHLSFVMLLVWTITALLWYGQITQISKNLSETTTDTLSGLKNIFVKEVQSEAVSQSVSIFGSPAIDTKLVLSEYSQSVTDTFTNSEKKYDPLLINDLYNLYPITPIAKIGILTGKNALRIQQGFQLLKLLFKLFVLIGAVALFMWKFSRSSYYKEYLLLMIFAWGIIALMLVHPTLATHYNLSRLYLQMLFLLSLAGIWGALVSMAFLPHTARHVVIGVMLGSLFAYQHGLFTGLIGGFAPISLYNFGEDFDKFYVHRGEMVAAEWLSKNKEVTVPVFADEISNLRTMLAVNMRTLTTVIPQTIYQDSYVYARWTNLHSGTTQAAYDGKQVLYVFPSQFFSQTKNVVYDNTDARIYR